MMNSNFFPAAGLTNIGTLVDAAGNVVATVQYSTPGGSVAAAFNIQCNGVGPFLTINADGNAGAVLACANGNITVSNAGIAFGSQFQTLQWNYTTGVLIGNCFSAFGDSFGAAVRDTDGLQLLSNNRQASPGHTTGVLADLTTRFNLLIDKLVAHGLIG